MKIEMGESLAASWLRHICGCALVQQNWKPSPRWQEFNLPEIEQLVQNAKNHFGQLNVFKQNADAAQILHQTECDVVGLERFGNGERWHVVEVAFHENGVQYGDKNETASKIAGKMFRAAIGLYCYMNTKSGSICFATPKATHSYVQTIQPAVELVAAFFHEHGFDYQFNLLMNDAFRVQLLNPVMDLAGEVSDTSELFLRAVQMQCLFDGQDGHHPVAQDVPDVATGGGNADAGIKVGKLVNTVMRPILEAFENDAEVEDLLNAAFCKDAFGVNYPLLVHVGDQFNADRYYATPLTICGVQYRLCNDWYPRNRAAIEAWIANHSPHED